MTYNIKTSCGVEFLINVHPESELLSDIIRVSQCYSRNDLLIFRFFAEEGDYIIDAGANIGWHTIFAGKLLGPSGLVISFEPDEKNYSLLCDNIKLNQLTNVIAVNKAVSDSCETATMSRSQNNFGDHIVVKNHDGAGDITCTTIDKFISDNKIDATKIKLVKMDIQGFEPYALKGMENFVKAHRPAIIIEFSPLHLKMTGTSPFDILSFIDRFDYIPYHILEDRSLPPDQILNRLGVLDLVKFSTEQFTGEYTREWCKAIDILLVSNNYDI